jgi:hypothetical protein
LRRSRKQFNGDPLSASAFVRPQIETLASRGHDGIPASAVQSM